MPEVHLRSATSQDDVSLLLYDPEPVYCLRTYVEPTNQLRPQISYARYENERDWQFHFRVGITQEELGLIYYVITVLKPPQCNFPPD